MKSSRLPPSAHFIRTLFGGDNVRGGKGRKGDVLQCGYFWTEGGELGSNHAWLVWRFRFSEEYNGGENDLRTGM